MEQLRAYSASPCCAVCSKLLPYKDKLRQAQWLVAERHIIPIKIVKVGDKDRPASAEDLQAVQDELTNIAQDPLLTLVTHHAFDFDFVGACYDDKTEVLTKRGFISLSDTLPSDEIGCLNPVTNQMEWHSYQEKHSYDYDSAFYGPMRRFHGKHINLCVTPNHQMWARKRKWNAAENKYDFLGWAKHRADKISDHDKFLSSLGWTGTVPQELPYAKEEMLSSVSLSDFLALVGYYVSEGSQQRSIENGVAYTTQIYQKKGSAVDDKIRALMIRCFGDKARRSDVNSEYYDTVSQHKLHSKVTSSYLIEEFGVLSQGKKLPRWILDLPPVYLEKLLESMMEGDGNDHTQSR